MAGCTAPKQGHRTASGRANCPVCRYRGGYRRAYNPPPRTTTSYWDTSRGRSSGGGSGSSGGGGGGGGTRRLRGGRGTVSYSPTEWRAFEPAAREAEKIARVDPEARDVFLCHAWDDREDAARTMQQQLAAAGASVWFSEDDIPLGAPMMREIDKGLSKARLGIVLVTPAFLRGLKKGGGIADKELSALLHSERLLPVAHGVTFEEIREVSVLLASRAGLTINEALSMADAARKIAATAAVQGDETKPPGASRDW